MENKVVLSIALMVSNRKDTIKQCLDSLTPIREQIPCELIILDTGCDDDVRKILDEYGDIVKEFAWCKDFSKARNETLKYATGEWYLYLDDDEWFVDVEELVDFFKTGDYKNYGYASYIQRNFLDRAGSQYSDSWVSRMIKRTEETHFVSKIHEYMTPQTGNCRGIRSIVHHYGYIYDTEEELWNHYERNVVLIKEMLQEDPGNLRWRMQLAQEYRSVNKYDELFELGEETVLHMEEFNEKNELYANIALGSFYASKIISLYGKKKYQECIDTCEEALKDARNSMLFRAYSAFYLIRCGYWTENFGLVKTWAEEYFCLYRYFCDNEPIWYLQRNIAFVGECFDETAIKEVYSILFCIGLKQNEEHVLDQYLIKLNWEESHLYVFEDIVPVLIDSMNRPIQDDSQKVESFSKVLKLMYQNTALWEYFCDEVMQKQEQGQSIAEIMSLIKRVLPEAVDEESPITELTPEMQQLKENIIRQLSALMESGMMEQAKEIIVQVRKILPGDEELKEMEKQLASF